MDDGAISLTAGFPSADEATWRALVEKTLNGAAFEKRLVSKTYDGIAIQPLYTAANAAMPMAGALRQRTPFDADRAWDIRALVDHPDPADANRLLMDDLEGGSTSLLVKIDPSGQTGVAIASEADLRQTLNGVLFDLAPIALDAGYLGPEAAQWLSRIAQSKTLKPHLHLHLDPISTFSETGVSEGSIQAHIDAAAQVAAQLEADSAFLASGQVAHEAGGTEAQEIAVVAAAGLAYVKAAVEAGVSVNAAMSGIVLNLAADADYFTTIAKFRAAKAVWGRLTSEISSGPHTTRLQARSSRRMLSTLDPWVNMLRLTSAAFGASLGGANAVALDCFTQPLGRPTPFARRQARNIQLVLMEEAHLGRVVDPAGGAWFVETLTDQLARAAWIIFQAIEKEGGIVAALSSHFIADAVAEAREARRTDIAKRKAGLVGVSEFPNLLDANVEIDSPDVRAFAKPSPAVPKSGPDGACPPLSPRRVSEGFEGLRTRAKTFRIAPLAFITTIGAPKDYTGRVGFSRNALAAGGVEVVVGDAAAYEATLTPLAVICGSDVGYAEKAGDVARSLKSKGAKAVYLAGRPGDLEATLRAAGVDGFIFAGENLQVALSAILDAIESGSA